MVVVVVVAEWAEMVVACSPGDHIRQLALPNSRHASLLRRCFSLSHSSLTTNGLDPLHRFFFDSMHNRHQWRLSNAVPASEMAYMVQWLQ